MNILCKCDTEKKKQLKECISKFISNFTHWDEYPINQHFLLIIVVFFFLKKFLMKQLLKVMEKSLVLIGYWIINTIFIRWILSLSLCSLDHVFDSSFLIHCMLNREISLIEIFPLLHNSMSFLFCVSFTKTTHSIHILCFVLQARDFPLKCFLAIGRKFEIVS